MGKIKKFNKQQVQDFRTEFMKLAQELADKYEVDINLGNIRYGDDEMRTKMTVSVRHEGVVVTDPKKFNFPPTIGELVGINHASISKSNRYKVIRVNRVNIVVEDLKTNERISVNKTIILRF